MTLAYTANNHRTSHAQGVLACALMRCRLPSDPVTAPSAQSTAGMHRTHSSESLGQTAAQAMMTHLAGQQQGKGQGGGTPPVMHRSASGSLLRPAGAAPPAPALTHVHDSRRPPWLVRCASLGERKRMWVIRSGADPLLPPSAIVLAVPVATRRHAVQPQLLDPLLLNVSMPPP